MCGIAGWAGPAASRLRELPDLLERAAGALRHRGPDAEGFFFDAVCDVALAHRRLSIIDLSDAANQPMKLESAGLTLIFNGEIYNYRELRNELKVRGCRFRSQSDTEKLLHAWFEWGPSWSASEYALTARL